MRSKLVILLTFLSLALSSQTVDETLSSKILDVDLEVFEMLRDSGAISNWELQIAPVYAIKMITNGVNLEELSFQELLDSVRLYLKRLDAENYQEINYGNDSVFIRTPYNERVFQGMGEMSLEKLIERESRYLPIHYPIPDLNVKFDDPREFTSVITKLDLGENKSMLYGNAMYILAEQNTLMNYRVGDLLLIAIRIERSKEFQPFL